MSAYLNKIKKVIVTVTGIDPDEITEESYFEDDLNIGEMELVDILTELEEEFQVDLVGEKDNIKTIEDIIDLLVEEIE